MPAFGETTQFEHIKKHYTKSHKQINPHVSSVVVVVGGIVYFASYEEGVC